MQKKASITQETPKKSNLWKKITLTEDIDPSTNYKKKRKILFLRRRNKKKRIPKLQEKRKTDQPPCVTKF